MSFARTFVDNFLLALLAQVAALGGAVEVINASTDGALTPIVNTLLITIVGTAIVSSFLYAAEKAVSEYRDTKQKQELGALGLYCSNCAHLKRKMFRGLVCGITGTGTTESGGCANHSDYARRRYKPVEMAVAAEVRRFPSG